MHIQTTTYTHTHTVRTFPQVQPRPKRQPRKALLGHIILQLGIRGLNCRDTTAASQRRFTRKMVKTRISDGESTVERWLWFTYKQVKNGASTVE